MTAISAGKRYCPHYLGGGIGLAAVNCDDMLEIDFNPNPLRELLATPYPVVKNDFPHLFRNPGLGVEPNRTAAHEFLVKCTELTKRGV